MFGSKQFFESWLSSPECVGKDRAREAFATVHRLSSSVGLLYQLANWYGDAENRILNRVGEKTISMRLFIFVLTAFLFKVNSFAQRNNPQDQVGSDYVSSINIVKNDFRSGIVSAFDEQALARYNRSLPLNLSARFEDVTAIVQRLKSADYNFDNALSSSSLSPLSKDFISELAKNPLRLDKNAYLDNIVSKVDLINQSTLSNDEKKLTLSLAAIVYHMVDGNVGASLNARAEGCFGSGPDGSGAIDCSVFGAIAGGVIGSLICGFWPCGVIGIFVGGILGGLS